MFSFSLRAMSIAPQALKSVDAVGPAPMTTDELERALRGWLGLGPAHFLPLPRFVLGALAWLRVDASRPFLQPGHLTR